MGCLLRAAQEMGSTPEGVHLRLVHLRSMSVELETVSARGPQQEAVLSGNLPRRLRKPLKERMSTRPRALSHADLLSCLRSSTTPSRTFLLRCPRQVCLYSQSCAPGAGGWRGTGLLGAPAQLCAEQMSHQQTGHRGASHLGGGAAWPEVCPQLCLSPGGPAA